MQEVIHLHCENNCQKVVFIYNKDGKLVCIKCGGAAVNEPECECLDNK